MEFTLPSAPTDNLYKFLAVFGLIFAGTTFFYADYMENEARKLVVEYANDATLKTHELIHDFAERDAKDRPEVIRKQEHFKEMLDTKGSYTLAQAKRADYYKTLRNVGGSAGLLLSMLGFVLWYRRVQRYEDQALRKSAEMPNNSFHRTLRDKAAQRR